MKARRLSAKFLIVGFLLLGLALTSISLTMWVTRQLDGGAAAVNEAGRLRMQAWRLASGAEGGRPATELPPLVTEFDATLTLLRQGDAQRPLFVPWSSDSLALFAALETQWQSMRPLWLAAPTQDPEALFTSVDALVAQINRLVLAIEHSLARYTAVLNLFQMIMMGLAVLGAALSLYIGYLFVIYPLNRLRHALLRVERGDFTARVEQDSCDEFGELASGFNHMAQTLESLYHGLERKVQDKTAALQAERTRLQALYEVSTLLVESNTLDGLAQGFARKLRELSGAAAAAVRWVDPTTRRYVLLASDCLPDELVQQERCLNAGQCACGQGPIDVRTHVIPIVARAAQGADSCARAGYASVLNIPVRLQARVLGEVNLFFHHELLLSLEDRGLYDALAGHLASAVENLRTEALVREAAVSEERALLARELHDSIAQSLSFMKIQMGLLQQAVARAKQDEVKHAIAELDAGLRESTSDVRELLLHFRTRTNSDDIEDALRSTLRKFEHQTGLHTQLEIRGDGVALASDVQLQVLHVLQEALSNVRKHAGASDVRVTVDRGPRWRFVVRDNGCGFERVAGAADDDVHVGLHIMRERAQRIGARVDVRSTVGEGTEVCLSLEP